MIQCGRKIDNRCGRTKHEILTEKLECAICFVEVYLWHEVTMESAELVSVFVPVRSMKR